MYDEPFQSEFSDHTPATAEDVAKRQRAVEYRHGGGSYSLGEMVNAAFNAHLAGRTSVFDQVARAAGGGYDQQVAPYAAAHAQQVAQQAAGAPQVLINPNYYNSPTGQAQLQREAADHALTIARGALQEMAGQGYIEINGQRYQDAPGPGAQMAQGALQDLNEIAPLVRRGLLGPNDVQAVVKSAALGDIAGQRNERQAAKDFAAIREGWSNGTFTDQQVAGAVSQMEKRYGASLNLVPEYLQYKGALAQPTSPQEFLTLNNKLAGPIPGLASDSLSKARSDYLIAAQQLSQPGVTKQHAAAIQQQFAQLHPEFAAQAGLPSPLDQDQLVHAAGTIELANAQAEANDVPLVRDFRGNIRVNEGWQQSQKFKLQAAEIAHQQWLEQIRTENDYLRSIDPGNKEPLDPDEANTFKQSRSFFQQEQRRIMGSRMQNRLPAPGSAPNATRDASTVDSSGPVVPFNDGARAEQAFRNGTLPAGRPFIVRGTRFVFDQDGKATRVQ